MQIIKYFLRFVKYVADFMGQLFIGRINRLQFSISFLLTWFIPFGIFITISNNANFTLYILSFNNPAAFLIVISPLLACWFIFYSSFVRRLHDIGMPGWFTLIPILGQILVFSAFFTPGEKDKNVYGYIPNLKKSLVSIIFAAKRSEMDKGEKWLASVCLILANLFIVLIICYLIGFLTFIDRNSSEFAISSKNINFQGSVKKGEVKIVCGSNSSEGSKIGDIKYKKDGGDEMYNMDKIIDSVVKTCGNTFDAYILYGNGDSNLINGRENHNQTSNEFYLFVLSQVPNQNDKKIQVTTTIYRNEKDNDSFKKVYKDAIGTAYVSCIDEEENYVTSDDINDDGVVDWQIYISTELKSEDRVYYTYVYKSENSFVKWIQNNENPNSNYLISDEGVYYYGTLILGAHTPSFEIINYQYGKDKKYIYLHGKILPNLDPNTFSIVKQNYSQDYVKDASGVYYLNNLIVNANPKTFEYIDGIYSRDQNYVFRETKIIGGADPKTFQIVFDPKKYMNWGKDKNFVYYQDQKIKGANKDDFQTINQVFGKDNKNLFYKNTLVEGVDLKSLKLVSENYNHLADKYRVYLDIEGEMNPVVFGADPNTFSIIESFYFKDKSSIFYKNKKIEKADPETFKILYYGSNLLIYASDKNHVYMNGEIVPNENPETFKIPEQYNRHDY